MPVAEGDFLKAVWRVKHTSPNTIVENIYHWQVTTLVDGDFDDVHGELLTLVAAAYAHFSQDLSPNYVLQDFRVTDESQKMFVGDGVGAGFTGTGIAGAQVLPAQDAAMVLFRSRNLGHIGRKYIGPLLEDAADDGELAAATVGRLESYAQDLEVPLTGGVTGNTYQPGTLKYNAGGAPASFTPFDADLCKILLDFRTQRRRRPGVGLT